jgi:Tol biopolymer transport system component
MVTNSGEQILLLNCVWGSSSWSPDGNSLATWGVECEESCAFVDQKVLNIFDITEGKDEVYSIYPGDIEGVISTAQYPIWSPDNQFIAFTTYDGTLSPAETIILDLTRDKAFILPETMEVLGWMRAEP